MSRSISRRLALVAVFLAAATSTAVATPPHPVTRAAISTVQVTASPASYTNVPSHTTYQAATFTVKNLDDATWIYLSCSVVGYLTCESISADSVYLVLNQTTTVTVRYTSGATGITDTLKLTGTSSTGAATGRAAVTMGASRITFRAPSVAAGGTIDVHTRRPILLAEYNPPSTVDTLATVVSWRGSSILTKAQRSDRMVEWEVDSASQLNTADSVAFQATFCTLAVPVAQCSTEKIMVRLPNDQKPMLDFTGIPRGSWGGGFSTGFGPGVGLGGAEIVTGFSTVPYVLRGGARSTSMVYSTRTSYPRVLIPVNLELPWPAGTPDEVKVVLYDGATRLDSTRVTSTACATGAAATCRTVLEGDFSASTFSTPTRKWLRVEVSVTSGATIKQSSDSVEVVLVDRRTTQYGSGWWPAAQSKIVTAGNDRLLIGADGGATVFRGATTASVFVSPPGSTTRLVVVGGNLELHPRGSLAKVVFNGSGQLVKTVDPDGNRDSLSYAGTTDTLLAIRDLKNHATAFAYNGTTHRLASITSLSGAPGARTTGVSIDTANFLVADSLTAAPYRPKTRFMYQRFGTLSLKTVVLTQVIGGTGVDTTTIVYDSTNVRRRPTRALPPRVADENGSVKVDTISVTLYERQGWHALRSLDSVYVEVKDPRNNWARSLLNRYAQSLRSWDALGLLGRAQYDAVGRVLWSEGKNGDSSRVYTDYDNFGRMARTYILRSPTDRLRLDSLVYDANHRPIKNIDSRGQADSAAYDSEGHLVYVRDPAGNVTLFRYTADGLQDSVQVPNTGAWSRVTFDTAWQNIYQRYGVDGRIQAQTTYDSMGRATETRGLRATSVGAGIVQWHWWRSRTRYDLTNAVDSTSRGFWLECVDTPCSAPSGLFILTGHTESILRDNAGRDTLQVEWVGTKARKTKVRYDRLGRMIVNWSYADSTSIADSMFYDIAGNLVRHVTRRGTSITSAFDSRNRDTLTTIPGVGNLRRAFGGPNDELTRLWYDSPVDSIGGVDGTRAWVYDSRGRLKADSLWLGATPRATTYAYDSFERTIGVADGSIDRTFGYDSLRGLLNVVRTSEGDTLAMTFDGQGRLTAQTLRAPSSAARWIATTQSYKPTGELFTQLNHLMGTNPSDTFDVGSIHPDSMLEGEYSGASLAQQYSYQAGAGTAVHNETSDIQYAPQGEMNSWVGKRDGTLAAALTYNFDDAGNISTGSDSRTYDTTTNRLVVMVVGSHKNRYFYDKAGNVTSSLDSVGTSLACEWQYGYDALDRLISVRARTSASLQLVARYSYDVLGNRIVRRVYGSPCIAGVDTGYTRYAVWDGQVRFETIGVDASHVSTTNRYVWGPGTDNLLVADHGSGTTRYFAITDQLGSVRAWIQQDGTWKRRLRYDPYGNVVADSADTHLGAMQDFPYRWAGREYDPETGFYFLRSRYFDPKTARFTQEDPIGTAGGSNLYEYVGGQPLSATDPTGLLPRFDPFATVEYAMGSLSFLSQVQAFQEWAAQSRAQLDAMEEARNHHHDQIADRTKARGGVPLTPEQKKKLGDLCSANNAKACDEVRVHITTGREHSFGKDISLKENYPIWLLAHEVFHYVDQYKSMGALNYYVQFGILHAEEQLFGTDLYSWQPGLAFREYGLEQQGQIVQDCYHTGGTACDISPYHPGS